MSKEDPLQTGREGHSAPSSPEKLLPIPEIKIPKEVEDEFRGGTNHFLERLGVERPLIVLTLPRSGTIVSEGVREAARARGLELPSFLPLAIGRSLPDRFTLEENIPLGTYEITPEGLARYYQWLKDDPEAVRVVERIAEAPELQKLRDEKNVSLFILDDVFFEGVTGITSTLIMIEALKRAGVLGSSTIEQPLFEQVVRFGERDFEDLSITGGEKTVRILRSCVFLNSWRYKVLESTFGKMPGANRTEQKAVLYLLSELSRGKIFSGGTTIQSYDDWGQVVELGEKLSEKAKNELGDQICRNPASILEETYDRNDLMRLQEGLTEALRGLGRRQKRGSLGGNK